MSAQGLVTLKNNSFRFRRGKYAVKVTVYLQGSIFYKKKLFKAKLNITSQASLKRKKFKLLKRERVINKTLFQMKFYYPPEYDKPIKIFQPGLLVTFFAVKYRGSFISCRFSYFCLRLHLVIMPSFRLCWFCVSCMDKNKKENSSWLKSKKKTGPKKKVFDEGWRKALAETDKGSWFN